MGLIWKNIKNFAVHHKGMFVVFLVSQMVSALSVLYVTSVFQASQNADREYQDYLRAFSVVLPEAETSQSLETQLLELQVEFGQEIRQLVVYGETLRVKANLLYPPYHHRAVYTGSYFAPEAFSTGSAEIILHELPMTADYRVGDTYLLLGKPYTIVGLCGDGGYNEVPYGALPEELPLSQVQLFTAELPTKAQTEEITRRLAGIFPEAAVLPPEMPDFQLFSQHNMEYLVCMLIFLLSVVNIAYLFQFILEKRKSQLALIRTCGCTTGKAWLMYLAESVFLFTLPFLCSALILHFGISRWFSALNGSRPFAMGLAEYLSVYFVYLLLLLVVFSVFILRFVKRPIISVLRG